MIAKAVRGYDVIAISPEEMVSLYAKWFRVYGLFDYVDDILKPGEEELTVEVDGGPGARLTVHNVQIVIGLI
jgi:hypothetical protein